MGVFVVTSDLLQKEPALPDEGSAMATTASILLRRARQGRRPVIGM
jgi:hypothetical protein